MPWRPATGAPRHSARGYVFLIAEAWTVAGLPLPSVAVAMYVIGPLLRTLMARLVVQVPATTATPNGPTVCVPSVTATCTVAPLSTVPETVPIPFVTGFVKLVMAMVLFV